MRGLVMSLKSLKRFGPLALLKKPIKIMLAPTTNVAICSAIAARKSIETNRAAFAPIHHHAEKLRSCNLFATSANNDTSKGIANMPAIRDAV